jgi:hypothetical protein
LILDTPVAAAAAIAALSELQCLRLDSSSWDLQGNYPFAAAQFPTRLTQLRLGFEEAVNAQHQQLSQLSALVNLQHLELNHLSYQDLPGGLPSQLQSLTRLHMHYSEACGVAAQLQHLSSLTALCHLSIAFQASDVCEGDLTGMHSSPS